jgi:hypothetical protein
MSSVKKPTPEHEAFYQECVAGMQKACERHPNIRNAEIIAILGRMVGYCIAMCYPDERDLARHSAIVNMDMATKDVAPSGPSTAGRA